MAEVAAKQRKHKMSRLEKKKVDCQASATPKKTSKGVRQPNLLRGL